MKPLVSIVIPVYNVEKYLSRCLNSVLDQNYRNLEIILVDDGSTDKSSNICDEYKDKDERIKVIHQQNKGLSGARNSGIDTATGEYICFIDSDDYISNYYVEQLIKTSIVENSDIVTCGYIQGYDDNYIFDSKKSSSEVYSYSSADALANWHDKYKKVETVAWNKLYKFKLFETGIRYPVGKYFEDVPTTHLLVSEAQTISFINSKLYYYYQRNSSIQGSPDDNKIEQRMEMQTQRFMWFKNHGYFSAYERLVDKYLKYLIICYAQTESINLKDTILKEFREIKNSANIHNRIEKLLYFGFCASPELYKNLYLTMKKCSYYKQLLRKAAYDYLY